MINPRNILSASVVVLLSLLPTLSGCGGSGPAPRVAASASPAAEPGNVPADRRARFLDALREAGIAVSLTGESEVLIAEGICKALAAGTPEARLVDDMRAMGAVWTPESAMALIRAARAHHCIG